MRAEHLAIDGAVVTIEGDADLSTKATATGWAVVPSLMRAHPFGIYPPGHSALVEQTVRASVPSIKILATEDYSIKNGRLRVAEIQRPAPTGGDNQITVGAWEGASGCLHTSMWGSGRARVVEIFETLSFSEHSLGLAIDSRVVAEPRTPEVVKEIPDVGVLSIRPAIPRELERVPKSRGAPVDHGEVFRIRNNGASLLYVSNSAVVVINPLPRSDPAKVLGVVQRLRVEWAPRTSTASAN